MPPPQSPFYPPRTGFPQPPGASNLRNCRQLLPSGAQICATVVNYCPQVLKSVQLSSIMVPGGSQMRNCRQLWLLEAQKCATVTNYGSWRLTSAQLSSIIALRCSKSPVLQASCPPNLLSKPPVLQASYPTSLLSSNPPVLQASCPLVASTSMTRGAGGRGGAFR